MHWVTFCVYVFNVLRQCVLQEASASESVYTEDSASVAAHVKWLEREFKKPRHDIKAVTDRMDRTFSDRRQMLLSNKIDTVLQRYVFLRDPQEVTQFHFYRMPNAIPVECKT